MQITPVIPLACRHVFWQRGKKNVLAPQDIFFFFLKASVPNTRVNRDHSGETQLKEQSKVPFREQTRLKKEGRVQAKSAKPQKVYFHVHEQSVCLNACLCVVVSNCITHYQSCRFDKVLHCCKYRVISQKMEMFDLLVSDSVFVCVCGMWNLCMQVEGAEGKYYRCITGVPLVESTAIVSNNLFTVLNDVYISFPLDMHTLT